MAIVTDIVEKRGLIEVLCDGVTVARVRRAHYAKCPLTVGEAIEPEAWTERIAAEQFADGYEAALSSLDFCARSAKEIANSLRRRGYVEPCVQAVVARLTENHLIDDARYAERLAETQSSKPVGLYQVRRKLRAKGISEEDAEAALAVFDDEQQRAAALAAAQKLYRKCEALPQREAKSKLSQALARRGFAWDTIEWVVDEIID